MQKSSLNLITEIRYTLSYFLAVSDLDYVVRSKAQHDLVCSWTDYAYVCVYRSCRTPFPYIHARMHSFAVGDALSRLWHIQICTCMRYAYAYAYMDRDRYRRLLQRQKQMLVYVSIVRDRYRRSLYRKARRGVYLGFFSHKLGLFCHKVGLFCVVCRSLLMSFVASC